MPFKKITEYRKHAEECSRQSELTSDKTNKLHWLAMAEGVAVVSGQSGNEGRIGPRQTISLPESMAECDD